MKPETVKKVMAMLKTLLNEYMQKPFENLTLHISKGNQKIGNVWNFSLCPILTCVNCVLCMLGCYDLKACNQYLNVRIARAENTAMMYMDMAGTFQQIDSFLSRNLKHKFFRWDVSGDILSIEYFNHMVEIARNNPDWTFWTYTKAFVYVNSWLDDNGGKKALPKNLTVMFSQWGDNPIENPHNMPIFKCVMPWQKAPKNMRKCPGNCDICKEKKSGCMFGKSMWIRFHK